MSGLSLEAQVEELLSEDIASVMKREESTFDALTAPFSNSLVLFGAGNLGRRTLAGLRTLGIEPLAFTDNNPRLWNTAVNGIPVLPPDHAVRQFGGRAAFVVTIWDAHDSAQIDGRVRQLHDLDCPRVATFISLYWKYPRLFLPYFSLEPPHQVCKAADDIRQVFRLWADEDSRAEYVAQLRWRMWVNPNIPLSPVRHAVYFPNEVISAELAEVFVDCGAYDGDTIGGFLRWCKTSVGRIHAFEPDPVNFGRLKRYVEGLPYETSSKVAIYPFAVGAGEGKVLFAATGTERSSVASGAHEVDCVTLDGFLRGRVPTYIKMDIEGSEPDALVGARQLIAAHTPVLAICVYHRQDHLWRIPLFIHHLSDRYRFYLRVHDPKLWDYVCYAIPVDRL